MGVISVGIIVVAAVSIVAYATVSKKRGKVTVEDNMDNNKLAKIQLILRMLVDISTVISVILVFFTLVEMQKERDNAYRPNIVIETKTINMVLGKWDENNHLVECEGKYQYEDTNLIAYNIGVGSAEQVLISVDKNSYMEMCQYLDDISIEGMNSYSVNDKNYVTTYSDGHSKMSPVSGYIFEKAFILSNAQDKITIPLPVELLDMITDMEVCELSEINQATEGKEDGEMFSVNDFNIPDLILKVSFQDIQGKEYQQDLTLHINEGVSSSGKDRIAKIPITITATK